MPSFQISITPSKRAAGRFVSRVRRALQKALAEEAEKRDLTQADLARAIGVNRSVIHRELRGHKDLTLGRVAELAWALGRRATFDLPEQALPQGSNLPIGAASEIRCPPMTIGHAAPTAASGVSAKPGYSIRYVQGP